MPSKIDSKKIRKAKKSALKKLAHSERINPFDEMKIHISKYKRKKSNFKLRVSENKSNIKIQFSNKKINDQIKIRKNHKSSKVYNPAFGKYKYKDISLFSVSMRSESRHDFERVIAHYWGKVSDNANCKDFVRNKARILRRDFVIGPIQKSQNVIKRNQFVATDVNAYTKDRKPNPWCRNCLILIYEDSSIVRLIKKHKDLGIPKSEFQPILSSNIIKQKHIN
jgi:hypothetical protein